MRTILPAILASAAAALTLSAQPTQSYLTTDRPVATNEIKIGVSAGLSGRSAAVGNDYLTGARVFFDGVNSKEKGIFGRSVKLVALDDRYEFLPAVLNTRRLINDEKVFCLMNYMGAVSTRAVGLMIGEAQIPLIGAYTGAQSLRQPINRYLFHLRPGFVEETAEIVERLITDRSVTKIAVFHQADLDGESVRSGVERALRPRGAGIAVSASIIRNTVDVSAAADQMLAARPNAIILGASYQQSAALVKALAARDFRPIIVGTSMVGAENFIEYAGGDSRGVFFTQVVPLPSDTSVRLVDEFQSSMKAAKDPSFTHAALEGYLNAAAVATALREAKEDLNTARFLKALENLNVDIGGLNVTFTPSTRQALKQFYLTAVSGGKLIKVEKFTAVN